MLLLMGHLSLLLFIFVSFQTIIIIIIKLETSAGFEFGSSE